MQETPKPSLPEVIWYLSEKYNLIIRIFQVKSSESLQVCRSSVTEHHEDLSVPRKLSLRAWISKMLKTYTSLGTSIKRAEIWSEIVSFGKRSGSRGHHFITHSEPRSDLASRKSDHGWPTLTQDLNTVQDGFRSKRLVRIWSWSTFSLQSEQERVQTQIQE